MIESEKEYCRKYFIPEKYLWEILQDSKVVPMIRGKASEYNAFLYLKKKLDSHKFSVDKLNLNAQTGTFDEDVSITHRATGVRLKVEVKNAVRGGFDCGIRSRGKLRGIPHFKVKCHKSRSNLGKAETTNDRYLLDDFDIVMSNVLNALYAGNTMTSELEFINEEQIRYLKVYYRVKTDRELEEAANEDWRFAFPSAIAEDCKGIMAIPRTPVVRLIDDPNWCKIDELELQLEKLCIKKAKELRKRKR